MALSEVLAKRGFIPEALRRPDKSVPLAERPELQTGGKGYLDITAAHNPDDPTSTSVLGVLPGVLRIKSLALNPKDASLTDFVVWNPKLVDLQSTRFPKHTRSIEGNIIMREDYLRKCGYQEFKLHSYPDRIVQIAVRRPARPQSPAEEVFPLTTNFQPGLETETRGRFERLKRFAKKVSCMD